MKNGADEKQVISISPQTIIFTVGFLLLLYFFYYIRQIVTTLFLAFVLMSALSPSVRFLEKKLKFPRILAILFLYVLFVLGIVVLLAVILPPLLSELPNLINTLALPPLPDDIRHLKFSVTELSSFLTQVRSSFSAILNIITSTFNGVFSFVTILVMTSYLLLDRDNLHRKVMWFSRDRRYVALAKEYLENVERHLGGWVRGQISLMVIIGVATYIGLSLLSIPYALPLALLAGFLEVMPNLGPTLAAVPAVLIAYLTLGPAMAGFLILFYIIVQQFENNLIVPKIMKDNVDVNPLVTIIVILIGLKLSGVIGALLAVPVYIVIRAAYSVYLSEKGQDAEKLP
jgi:predicted PurR-regulated permease PerM